MGLRRSSVVLGHFSLFLPRAEAAVKHSSSSVPSLTPVLSFYHTERVFHKSSVVTSSVLWANFKHNPYKDMYVILHVSVCFPPASIYSNNMHKGLWLNLIHSQTPDQDIMKAVLLGLQGKKEEKKEALVCFNFIQKCKYQWRSFLEVVGSV